MVGRTISHFTVFERVGEGGWGAAYRVLDHPNVLHIYDIEQSDGTEFIAMGYVRGKLAGVQQGRAHRQHLDGGMERAMTP